MTEILDALHALGAVDDKDIALGEASLLLAAVFHPGISLERYRHHLDKLARETGGRHQALLDAGAEDSVETRLAALKHILADKHAYQGDYEEPDHIQNADMVRVIDRGRGNAVTLSILYLQTARTLGWAVSGLDIPGHFAVRLDHNGQRVIFDPFTRCKVLQAPDLRRIVKQSLGPQAELSADYYEAAPHRAILTRLQNHIKLRQIEAEDYESALKSVEAMRAFNPAEYRLLLDAGVLYARTQRREPAIEALESYISRAPDPRDRQEAAILLTEVRQMVD